MAEYIDFSNASNAHKIIIEDVIYGNVGEIKADPEIEYYYDVVTLNGASHKKIRYRRTNYIVTFFNLLDSVYDLIRQTVKYREAHNSTAHCGIPCNDMQASWSEQGFVFTPIYEDGFKFGDYYLSLQEEEMKGYHNGKYYKNGLTVYLKAVNPDE